MEIRVGNDERSVKAAELLPNNEHFNFTTTDIRRERTGIHARVSIGRSGGILAYSTFNIDRDEDRTRLSNKSYRMLGTKAAELVSKDILTGWVDQFCAGVWPAFTSVHKAKSVRGEPVEQPLEFIAGPHVVEGGGTIIFGPPGLGKSWTGMLMAVAVDSGTNGFWKVRQTKAMFINLERGSVNRATPWSGQHGSRTRPRPGAARDER